MANFITMLTYDDKTVDNASDIFASCADLPNRYWGFKDVGLPEEKMGSLVEEMKGAGKETFLEVVSLSEEECLRGAELAVRCEFDYLMGTVYYRSVFDYLQKKDIRFFPFCGTVSGHPSVLSGSHDAILKDALTLAEKGADGLDLLAYRHADRPEELIRRLVREVKIPLVVAGSINDTSRLDIMKEINPWGFTIGTALFDRNFTDGEFRDQLKSVIDYMNIR